jgi:hypothetical protein
MRRCCATLVLALLMAVSNASAANPRLVDGVSGAPIDWSDWVSKRGPVAVLVWASWTPDATATLRGYERLVRACEEKGLELVLLDVQETLEDGRRALASHDGGWLHDRHGVLLKQYRVISIPSLMVVAAGGEILAKMEPTPEAIGSWGGP